MELQMHGIFCTSLLANVRKFQFLKIFQTTKSWIKFTTGTGSNEGSQPEYAEMWLNKQ